MPRHGVAGQESATATAYSGIHFTPVAAPPPSVYCPRHVALRPVTVKRTWTISLPPFKCAPGRLNQLPCNTVIPRSARHIAVRKIFAGQNSMTIGTVKFLNTSKGFGFIAAEGGGKDVFVHATAVEAAGLRSLTEGQKVSFDIVPDARGAKASNLKAV